MRLSPATIAAIVIASTALSGCELIGDLIKLGVWTGVILVVVVGLLIYWLMKKLRG